MRKSYLETRDKALAMKKAGDVAQARDFALKEFAPVVDRYNAVADKMVAYQIERSEAQAAEANALIRSYRMAVVVAGVAGLALLVVLSLVLVARIRQSLSEVSGVARRIARATCPAPAGEWPGRGGRDDAGHAADAGLAGAYRGRGAPQQRQHCHRLQRD